MTVTTRADDERVLGILDVAAHDGTRAAIERFGVTNSTVQGLVTRTFARNPARDPWKCEARKPENKDGGMKRGWWK